MHYGLRSQQHPSPCPEHAVRPSDAIYLPTLPRTRNPLRLLLRGSLTRPDPLQQQHLRMLGPKTTKLSPNRKHMATLEHNPSLTWPRSPTTRIQRLDTRIYRKIQFQHRLKPTPIFPAKTQFLYQYRRLRYHTISTSRIQAWSITTLCFSPLGGTAEWSAYMFSLADEGHM